MTFSDMLSTSTNERVSFLLGMIYSWPMVSKDNKTILAYSKYEKGDRSKLLITEPMEKYYDKHKSKLEIFLQSDFKVYLNKDIKSNEFLKTVYKTGVSVEIIFDIKNSQKIEIDTLIYGLIEKWLVNKDKDIINYFLSGLFDGRGSLDFNHKLIAIDIEKQNKPKIVRRKLNKYNDLIGSFSNYNPRKLQAKSDKKYDQFRPNIQYFMGNIGLFNPFKIDYYRAENGYTIKFFDNIYKDKKYKDKAPTYKKTTNLEINDLSMKLENINLSENDRANMILEFRNKFFKDADSFEEKELASINVKNNAKEEANYKCEFDLAHDSFISKSNNKQYVEGHHLIPFSKRNDFELNIDIEENIVALCPNCHRKIHHAIKLEREALIIDLYNKRVANLIVKGIDINIETLKGYY